MKTLREYIDQLDEISRRDFLKGAGAVAAGAALGKPATAQKMVFMPGPGGEATDPPLPRTKNLKPLWKYYNPSVLNQEELQAISKLIRLLYVARMTQDNYRDSQGGRILSGGIPSKIYKDAYDLLVFINDSFLDLGITKAMNIDKQKLDKVQKENPQQWQQIQQSVLNQWAEILVANKFIAKKLGKQPDAEPPQSSKSLSTQSGEQNIQQSTQSQTLSNQNLSYEQKLGNHIKSRINYTKRSNENPEAIVKIDVLPTGELKRVMMIKPSADKDWNQAVERAVINSSPLPLRQDGTIPSSLELRFKPQDINESRNSNDSLIDDVRRIKELIKIKQIGVV